MSEKNNKSEFKDKNLIIGSIFGTKNPRIMTVYKVDTKVFDALANVEIGGKLIVRLYENKDGERKRTDAIGHLEYRTKAQVDADYARYQASKDAGDSNESVPI